MAGMRGLGVRIVVIVIRYSRLRLGGHDDDVTVAAHRRGSGMGVGQTLDMHHGLLAGIGIGSGLGFWVKGLFMDLWVTAAILNLENSNRKLANKQRSMMLKNATTCSSWAC